VRWGQGDQSQKLGGQVLFIREVRVGLMGPGRVGHKQSMTCPESKMPTLGCLHGALKETARNCRFLSQACYVVKLRYELTQLQNEVINGIATLDLSSRDLSTQIINGGRTFSEKELAALLSISGITITSWDWLGDTVRRMWSEEYFLTRDLAMRTCELEPWSMNEENANNESENSENDTTSSIPTNSNCTLERPWQNSILDETEQYLHLLKRDSRLRDQREGSKNCTKTITCNRCGEKQKVLKDPEMYEGLFHPCQSDLCHNVWNGTNWLR